MTTKDAELPEGTHGTARNPPGKNKPTVGSQVGNFSHAYFEDLEEILLPEAENLTSGKLKPGLKKEVEVPVTELPPGKRPRMDRLDEANAEVIEIKPKNLEAQGLAVAPGFRDTTFSFRIFFILIIRILSIGFDFWFKN